MTIWGLASDLNVNADGSAALSKAERQVADLALGTPWGTVTRDVTRSVLVNP